MIEPGTGDSLATGLLFLLNGAGAVLIGLPGRYRVAGYAAWALMPVCLGADMEGFEVTVSWPAFVETCFAVWALLFAFAFIRAARMEAWAKTEPHRTGGDHGRG